MLVEIDRFLRSSGMSPTRFGREAMNDPTLVTSLRKGRELRPAQRQKIRSYMLRNAFADRYESSRWRKKPIEVAAIRWTGDNYAALEALAGKSRLERRDDGAVMVFTLEGDMALLPGNWMVRGPRGEVYPVKADIFAETYERA